ncbi:MAG: hypothetical protein SFU85_01825 [Candidatus Methylacidiphilales bacterium]|nr:hypothetical protein [Candidatus Methylacidiphilales bacterium]
MIDIKKAADRWAIRRFLLSKRSYFFFLATFFLAAFFTAFFFTAFFLTAMSELTPFHVG